MRRYFMLAAPGLNTEQEKVLLGRFEGKVNWWHQLPGIWLLSDDDDLLSAQYLRALVQEIAPEVHILATEVQPTDYALRLSRDRLEVAASWIGDYWLK